MFSALMDSWMFQRRAPLDTRPHCIMPTYRLDIKYMLLLDPAESISQTYPQAHRTHAKSLVRP